MTDHRRAARRPVRQGAWIFLGAGSAPIPCIMLDVSSAGARLRFDEKIPTPDEFILVMSRDRRVNRRCEVVWRKDNSVGVRFLAAKSITPKPVKKQPQLGIGLPEEESGDGGSVPELDAADSPGLAGPPQPADDNPQR